jgi:hypothetical protein
MARIISLGPVEPIGPSVNDRLLIEVLHGGHETILEFKTNAWLAKQPVGRFQFTFTPTHGSLI